MCLKLKNVMQTKEKNPNLITKTETCLIKAVRSGSDLAKKPSESLDLVSWVFGSIWYIIQVVFTWFTKSDGPQVKSNQIEPNFYNCNHKNMKPNWIQTEFVWAPECPYVLLTFFNSVGLMIMREKQVGRSRMLYLTHVVNVRSQPPIN